MESMMDEKTGLWFEPAPFASDPDVERRQAPNRPSPEQPLCRDGENKIELTATLSYPDTPLSAGTKLLVARVLETEVFF